MGWGVEVGGGGEEWEEEEREEGNIEGGRRGGRGGGRGGGGGGGGERLNCPLIISQAVFPTSLDPFYTVSYKVKSDQDLLDWHGMIIYLMRTPIPPRA